MAREAGFRKGGVSFCCCCVFHVFAQAAALCSQFEQHGACDHCCRVLPRGTAGSAAAQYSGGAGAGLPSRVAGGYPVSDIPARCPWPRVLRALLPLSPSQAAGPAPESGVEPCVLRDKRKRRIASAMAVPCRSLISDSGTHPGAWNGPVSAACGGLKKVGKHQRGCRQGRGCRPVYRSPGQLPHLRIVPVRRTPGTISVLTRNGDWDADHTTKPSRR